MFQTLRYLLLQVRNPDDPMAEHEIECFARCLKTTPQQIDVLDLLDRAPSPAELKRVDAVLLGGSGDYSVAEGGSWITPALEAMQELSVTATPTFASCWGFQAMAQALGGTVVTDLERAEVGSLDLWLTDAGRDDPVFQHLRNGQESDTFVAQLGHQDIVDVLPEEAVLLASSQRTHHQAFRLRDKPIYATQFHPELSRIKLLDRLREYPKYIKSITGLEYDQFVASTRESPGTELLLEKFVLAVFGD